MPDEIITRVESIHLPALRPDYHITDAEALGEANALLEDLTAKEKIIEKLKDEKYTPARKALDELRSIFDAPLKRIKEYKDLIRTEAKRYLQVEEAKRLAAAKAEDDRRNEEMRKLEEKRLKAEAAGKSTAKIDAKMVSAALAPSLVLVPVEKPDGMNRFVKTTGKYYCVDKNGERTNTPDLSVIPLQYHILDEARMGALARAPGNKDAIPGICWYRE
jgi:hypothetical protein